LIGGEVFDGVRTIDKAIAGAIVSSDLSQGARRPARGKQGCLSSDQCCREPYEKPVAVPRQVNDRRFFRKQVSEGSHV
jgi:hypothetical protein